VNTAPGRKAERMTLFGLNLTVLGINNRNMENLQSALSALKNVEITLRLVNEKLVTGKVEIVGADFVCVVEGEESVFIPYTAIIQFSKPGTGISKLRRLEDPV
jgi:hypothetical protein